MGGFQNACCVVAGLFLLVLPSAAQLRIGSSLKLNLSGDLSVGYDGAFGNQNSSGHDIGIGGDGSMSGYYFNPAFISFNARPYYGRSQSNSTFQSIGTSSGLDSSVNIFSGSHFPGSLSYGKAYNSTGQFGVPGTASLLSHGDGTSIGITWAAFLEGLPTLTAGFSKSTSTSSIYGTNVQNGGTGDTYNVASTYSLWGFQTNGSYMRSSTDSTVPSLLQAVGTESSGASSAYALSIAHSFPLHGSFSAGATRSTYTSSNRISGDRSLNSSSAGSSDSFNTNMNITPSSKVSAGFHSSYIDNLSGAVAQQIIGAGGAAPQTSLGSMRTLLLGGNAMWALPKNVSLNVAAVRQEQFFLGTTYGTTQINGNINFNYARPLFGALYFSMGVVDTASQIGNGGAGLVGNINFSRKISGFHTGANFSYSQGVQTIVAITTSSSYSYGVNVSRKLPNKIYWNAAAGGARSGFSTSGNSDSHAERASSGFSRRGFAVTANYSQSYGASILTANGLVSIPVGLPPGVILSNVIIFNATSISGGVSGTLFRKMTISGSYSQATGTTISQQLTSKNNNGVISTLLRYPYRKMYINAGYTRLNQGISTSTTVPSVVSSYYFGISRWFNVF